MYQFYKEWWYKFKLLKRVKGKDIALQEKPSHKHKVKIPVKQVLDIINLYYQSQPGTRVNSFLEVKIRKR